MPVTMPDTSTLGNVYLTYANTVHTDGVGAQLHRIYGIYALAKLVGARYLHSPLHHVAYHGLDALQQNAEVPDFVPAFNALFDLPSEKPLGRSPREVVMESAPLGLLDRLLCINRGGRRWPLLPIERTLFARRLRRLAKSNGEVIVKVVYPHSVIDRHVDGYEICKTVSPFRRQSADPTIRVALHVRRGELLFVNSERLIPSQYYINVAKSVASILAKSGMPFQIELHSEAIDRRFVVPSSHPAFAGRIDEDLAVEREQNSFSEFEVLPNLKRFINEPAITCIRRLATADVLVTSKSSFSYLAAILNVDGIVIYHPFWHARLRDWITAGPGGGFDRERFAEQMRRGAWRAGREAAA